MIPWLLASLGLVVSLAPCAIVALRGEAVDRLVGLEMAGVVSALLMLTLAEGMRQVVLYDFAIALATLSVFGGLVLVRSMRSRA